MDTKGEDDFGKAGKEEGKQGGTKTADARSSDVKGADDDCDDCKKWKQSRCRR